MESQLELVKTKNYSSVEKVYNRQKVVCRKAYQGSHKLYLLQCVSQGPGAKEYRQLVGIPKRCTLSSLPVIKKLKVSNQSP